MKATDYSELCIKESDFNKISSLIQNTGASSHENLEAELRRADIVSDEQYPADAVCLGSTIRYKDIARESEGIVTLVLPDQANMEQKKISILSPIGSALIGLRSGGMINWPLPGGKVAKIQILSVSNSL